MEFPEYKRRGGKRQRLAKAADKPEHQDSSLALWLFSQFAWGLLSPQSCQAVASRACDDYKKMTQNEVTLEDLNLLSKLGSSGSHENNTNRDLMSNLEGRSHVPSPCCFTIPMKSFAEEVCSYILLPHEWFACLYHHYFHVWQRIICPGIAELKKFWASVSQHPVMISHPIKAEEGWEGCTIPFTLHGDGTPVTGRGKTWSKQATIFSFRSMVASWVPNRIAQLYLWHIFDHLILKHSLHKAFQILQWSFYWLYLGVWPDKPWDSNNKSHRSYL